MKIHNKNYENLDFTIPNSIWTDRSINGLQKVLLPLIKKFTSNGTKPCEALTGQISQMLHTHEKDIKYNLEQLHKKGHIEIYKDAGSRTNYSITYTYKEPTKRAPESSGTSPVF